MGEPVPHIPNPWPPWPSRGTILKEDTAAKRDKGSLVDGTGTRLGCTPGGWPRPTQTEAHLEGASEVRADGTAQLHSVPPAQGWVNPELHDRRVARQQERGCDKQTQRHEGL